MGHSLEAKNSEGDDDLADLFARLHEAVGIGDLARVANSAPPTGSNTSVLTETLGSHGIGGRWNQLATFNGIIRRGQNTSSAPLPPVSSLTSATMSCSVVAMTESAPNLRRAPAFADVRVNAIGRAPIRLAT